MNADSEWDGLTQTVKKSVSKVQAEVEEVKRETKDLNEKLDR